MARLLDGTRVRFVERETEMAERARSGRTNEIGDAWGNWIASFGEWHLFGGLTYDQRRRLPVPPGAQREGARLRSGPRLTEDGRVRLGVERRPGRDSALADVRRFLDDGQQVLQGRLEAAVIALEYQRNGWPHFHPLLRLAGGLQDGDIATLGPLWFKLAGGNRLSVPRVQGDVCEYAAKYLAKGLDHGDVLIWPERASLAKLRHHQSGLQAAA